jgi:hypothetical protein
LLGAFLKAGINEFEISIRFCVFLIPILIFFKKKNFWVIIALFGFLKCKCEKNCTFSNILQKVKSYFFANIYHSPSDSYWNSKISSKLKPPSGHSDPYRELCVANKYYRALVDSARHLYTLFVFIIYQQSHCVQYSNISDKCLFIKAVFGNTCFNFFMQLTKGNTPTF